MSLFVCIDFVECKHNILDLNKLSKNSKIHNCWLHKTIIMCVPYGFVFRRKHLLVTLVDVL